jgi:hypothetical protein
VPLPHAVTWLEWGSGNKKEITMTKGRWFLLIGAVAFLVSTGRVVSEFVELKTSVDDVLSQALTVRI